ncbi:oxidoreductase [Antarcticibacterium flavum]|uniref:Oxidoreductase n=1 Tax=Antarcticibacterium flavum TaxID=2058175 RepID=A0A5B7X6X9_9FLAO|nr:MULTISPECIES: oxidoreductase [Antarcticibacterium]MCM4160623.1 oxidoreductase [Antarcticibacterium sp. W02-3]QCY71224.1 oxidoreductase [Antarcticibacterium flavum]
MKVLGVLLVFLLIGCNSNEKQPFVDVEVEVLLEDSISVRAIEIMGSDLAFAANNGIYGLFDSQGGVVRTNVQEYDSIKPEFRAVSGTSDDFFMLSVGNPALLYKTGDTGRMELVYMEEHENVFYDSMTFWNDEEGIGMGDPTGNCLSVIITRDGGRTWKKLSCEQLPETREGEAAFAASNSNIAVVGDHTWILSGGMSSRVFYSPDKGATWEVFSTPLIQGTSTTGGYSIDFYDEQRGMIIGGDYTNPEGNKANKAITTNGGKTWELIGDGQDPGYKSSIRYIPNGDAREIVAVGFTGISYSSDGGQNWNTLSEEGFYTIRFLNDSIAYAGGKNRLARLKFK